MLYSEFKANLNYLVSKQKVKLGHATRLKQKQQVTSVVAVVIITLPFQSAIGLNPEPLRIPWAYKMMAERHFDMTQTMALTAGQCSPLYHFLYRKAFGSEKYS